MAVEGGCGKLLLELFHQTAELLPLGRRTRILRIAIRIQSADIADPDRLPIVVLAMRPLLFQRTAPFYRTIQQDDKMVTDTVVGDGPMPTVDVGSGEVLTLAGRTTMDDDLCNFSFHDDFQMKD